MTSPIQSFGRAGKTALLRSIAPEPVLFAFGSGSAERGGYLPFGNGRSYGDSCLTSTGLHVDMRSMSKIVSMDLNAGLLVAEPGVLLGDLIAGLKGTGWFPPVVPGTQFVTLGGALANDIHGKNHHLRGTFGNHVISFKLARSDGGIAICSLQENPDLFAATIGGMGLTGIVIELTLQLSKVNAHSVLQQTIPFASLDGYFDLIENQGQNHEFAVAWIDQLATGTDFGRGLLLLGDHAETEAPAPAGLKLGVPFQPAFPVLNRASLRLFNMAYNYTGKRNSNLRHVHEQSFFFPLDAIQNWNRLYGPRGLYQHQSVIPVEAARDIVPAMLRATHTANEASFLTVLKKFGDIASPGLLSFPRPGHTLTLDFPNRGARTLTLLNQLDDLVLHAGGAINPYKDARMSAAMFKSSFPKWQQLEAKRDPAIVSDFWTRTALTH